MDLDKAIEKRHSVRRFKSKKPDLKKIIEAIEAGTKAPLAGNIPTIKFILVSDKEKIAELAEAATQDFIALSSYVVVVCSDPKQCISSYGSRAERYCRQQAGAAIENFLLKLTALGLSTSWVGFFSDITIRRILNIPDEVDVEAIFPIGYEFGEAKQKTKPNLDTCIYFDKYKNKYMKPVRKIEAI
ncbi:MAG: nitroreductase family protein [Nanoarchaeota archaeon]|nr:nitroreductase family protein [Nanoarchaeota archaeon]